MKRTVQQLTSEYLEPQEKQRWSGFAEFPPHPLYSYSSVETYMHLGTLWYDDSKGILPQVTT